MRDNGLKKNQAVIVFADPSETTEQAADVLGRQLLTDEEKGRHFFRSQDRHDYIVARALLRLGLSSCFSVEPRDWRFARDERGKPHVLSPISELPFQFSLSHTRGLVALLVSRAAEAGVDVEQIERTNDLALIAQRVCSKSELASLTQISGEKWKLRFFQLWTLKEAYSKARGLGLAMPFESVSFEIDAQENATTEDARNWQFHLTKIGTNHTLAAAVRLESEEQCEFELRKIGLTSG